MICRRKKLVDQSALVVMIVALVGVMSCDGSGNTPTAPARSVAGHWLGTVSVPDYIDFFDSFGVCTTSSVVDFVQQGSVLTGTFRQEIGKCPIADEVRFTGSLEAHGTFLIGTVEEGELSTRLSGPVFETQLILKDSNGTRSWVLTR